MVFTLASYRLYYKKTSPYVGKKSIHNTALISGEPRGELKNISKQIFSGILWNGCCLPTSSVKSSVDSESSCLPLYGVPNIFADKAEQLIERYKTFYCSNRRSIRIYKAVGVCDIINITSILWLFLEI